MDDSPLVQLLAALDRLDLDAVMALFTPDCQVATADGRRAVGYDGVRRLLAEFMSDLRWTTHEVTSQWHQDDVWFAEVLASYELRDWLRLEALPRAFVVRASDTGIRDLRAYGAHEHQLTDHRTGEEATWVGGQVMLPL